MKNKLEILEETVSFYSEDTSRRAITPRGYYMYNTGDGRHCAIGRCLIPELQSQGVELKGNDCGFIELLKFNGFNKVDDILQSQYHGHNVLFLCKLRMLHDTNMYWRKSGLSVKGSAYVDELKSELLVKE